MKRFQRVRGVEDDDLNVICLGGLVVGQSPVRQEMTRVRPVTGEPGRYLYNAAVSAARPAADYTARVTPHCDGVAIPLEDARMPWQR